LPEKVNFVRCLFQEELIDRVCLTFGQFYFCLFSIPSVVLLTHFLINQFAAHTESDVNSISSLHHSLCSLGAV